MVSIITGILLYTLFPPLELSFLAWFVLIPILIAVSYYGYVTAFFMTFLTGTVLSLLHIQWINQVRNFPFFSYIAISLYTGIFFGLFGLLYLFLLRRTRWPIILFAPALWVAIEYLRSNLSFLAIPWALMGYSQYDTLAVNQIASVTSVYGISFLIILLNSAFAEGILWALNRFSILSYKRIRTNVVFYSLCLALIILTGVYLWGNHQVKILNKNNNLILRVSLIQANIPQNEKWNLNFRKKIMDRYYNLTIEASQKNPDLIIWPESATPGYLKRDWEIQRMVRKLVRETGIPLLLGSATHAKINREGRNIGRLKNSAFFIDEHGQIISNYNKMRLLPFGEYLPMEGKFPWPRWLVPESGYFIPGTESKTFEHPKARFGVVICWESLFPNLFRKFVRAGSRFMVNITNEAWFGKTAAPRQLLVMSVFRSIENRVSLLRSANTGISCLIDPVGKIRERIMDENGNDVMVQGTMTVSVPGLHKETFYTRYGDLFGVTCSIMAVFLIILALFHKKIHGFSISKDRYA